MAPKKGQKGQKISLNEFLGDSALGSWADEMDSLPNAPAVRTEEDRLRAGDRYSGRRDDFLSSRSDRAAGPPREDLPLPSQPPYTAFVGNLAFDLTESDLENFFGTSKISSVKIIKDRDEKPKGFGYIEFEELDRLKEALAKSGTALAGRTVRVSVAEPPKERSGGAGFDDDAKFAGNWRREGPLPDGPRSRDSSSRRVDGAPSTDQTPSISENASDWRSSRLATRLPSAEAESLSKRRSSGFALPESQLGVADKEEVWTIGSKFKASTDEPSGSKFGGMRGRNDMGPPKDPAPSTDEGTWRSARPKPSTRSSISPNSSTPPTPHMGRRKLELLPRSTSASGSPSPLSSPKLPAVNYPPRSSNPFGAAKPVDVSSKEKEVSQRIEREREIIRTTHSMSRTSSKNASERSPVTPSTNTSAPLPPLTPSSPKPAASSVVRPLVTFASAASRKDSPTDESQASDNDKIEGVTDGEALATL